MTEPTDDVGVERRSASKMSHTSLNRAEGAGLLHMRHQVNLADPDSVASLLAEIELTGYVMELPDESGIYYLFTIDCANGRQMPVLIPEGWETLLVPALLAALTGDLELIQKFTYRKGMFPIPRPTR